MKIERIPIENREQWLRLRKHDVTASVVAALFGAHPYESALKVFAEKCGLEMRKDDDGVLRRGRLLEPAVGVAAAEERPHWRIEKASEYLRAPEIRLGATPDFWIHGDKRGLGVLQAKTVAPKAFRDHWIHGDEIVPPFWIVLQAITEMMLAGVSWGAVAALVVDPYRLDVHIAEIPRHAATEHRIVEAVAQFWADVAAGREPNPDYAKDGDLIAAMFPTSNPNLPVLDLSGDNRTHAVLAEIAERSAIVDEHKLKIEHLRTELRKKLGEHELATCGNWTISWKTQRRKAYSVPATEYRVLRVTERKPKADAGDQF